MRKILFIVFAFIFLSHGHAVCDMWQDVTGGLTDKEFYSIREHPGTKSEIIYVGTSNGLYKKDQNDTAWKQIFMCRGEYKGINHIDLSESNAIYIATKNGLYKSDNLGSSWKRIFKGIAEENYSTYVACDRENIGTVYLGTMKGLFLTKNGGKTWEKFSGIFSGSQINSISIARMPDAKNLFVICDNKLYKASEDFKNCKNIFNSDSLKSIEKENLDTEEVSEDSPAFLLNDITIAQNILYLSTTRGLFISRDSGISWQRFNNAGLLSRLINHVLVFDIDSPPDGEKIFAASKNGVFEYNEKKHLWNEIYQGMKSKDARRLMLTKKGNLWALCKTRVYKKKLQYSTDLLQKIPQDAKAILSRFKNEPSIKETLDMAIEYAEVYPDKINKWRKAVKFKALLPKITFGIDQASSDTYEIYTSSSKYYWLYGPSDRTEGWDLNFSWDLSNLVWNNSQTTIDIRSKLMVQLRDDIVDEVIRAYFERKRLQVEFFMHPPSNIHSKLEKTLRIEELTAILDGLTGGEFSRAIEEKEPPSA